MVRLDLHGVVVGAVWPLLPVSDGERAARRSGVVSLALLEAVVA